jgi:hypothetical protein
MTSMEEKGNVGRVLVEKSEGEIPLGNLRLEERIILNCVL